ncbi:unnamed protein product [Polarella glacialis]|uniref:SET domain-containing protein n=1 Tax=Polarella glacialis TaxID=89957 RepID=A0A813F7F6_POLGL|nr:unnamed protein product [Polarella glacialis]CAE8721877.1 unnamed protein product [Polarella glacialis]
MAGGGLASWAASRGIVVSPGLDFLATLESGRRGVRALLPVDPQDMLCLVPLEACPGHELWLDELGCATTTATTATTPPTTTPTTITPATTAAEKGASSDCKLQEDVLKAVSSSIGKGVLGCSLMLLHELGLGGSSVHAPYLETIPAEFSSLPFFTAAELEVLKGTSVDESLRLGDSVSGAACRLRAPQRWRGEPEARQHFEQTVGPLLEQWPQWWLDRSFRSFQRALGAVLSRGFMCQGQGPFLVPFADAFNHATTGKNHCRLEGCVADGLAFVMRAIRPAAAGDEVFNTYGPLPSARLLGSFGFVGQGWNPHDFLALLSGAQRCLEASKVAGRQQALALLRVLYRRLAARAARAAARGIVARRAVRRTSTKRKQASCNNNNNNDNNKTTLTATTTRFASATLRMACGALALALRRLPPVEAGSEPQRPTLAAALALRSAERAALAALRTRLSSLLMRRRSSWVPRSTAHAQALQ